MEKINIAELLKDCPKGMGVDCVLYNDVVLHEVHLDDRAFPIVFLRTTNGDTFVTTKYGEYSNTKDSKCIIFPKGKTTWEWFVPPCKFKDGDIVFYSNTIAIFKEWGDETLFRTYCVLYTTVNNHPIYQFEISRPLFGKGIRKEVRFATEKEKEKLFQAIRHSGYCWDHETKTLEKTNDLKFKIGDRITNGIVTGKIRSRDVDSYQLDNGVFVLFSALEKWKLDTSKFDITTLVPFESRVLVRDIDHYEWEGAIFGRYDGKNFYTIGGLDWKCCIPYEGNEYLFGTTNDCSEYYKTWEE